MDIIPGRAPPPARAESYRSKGSRELARPGPSLLEALGLRQPVANRGHCSQVAVIDPPARTIKPTSKQSTHPHPLGMPSPRTSPCCDQPTRVRNSMSRHFTVAWPPYALFAMPAPVVAEVPRHRPLRPLAPVRSTARDKSHRHRHRREIRVYHPAGRTPRGTSGSGGGGELNVGSSCASPPLGSSPRRQLKLRGYSPTSGYTQPHEKPRTNRAPTEPPTRPSRVIRLVFIVVYC